MTPSPQTNERMSGRPTVALLTVVDCHRAFVKKSEVVAAEFLLFVQSTLTLCTMWIYQSASFNIGKQGLKGNMSNRHHIGAGKRNNF